jgi:hypothetical protein
MESGSPYEVSLRVVLEGGNFEPKPGDVGVRVSVEPAHGVRGRAKVRVVVRLMDPSKAGEAEEVIKRTVRQEIGDEPQTRR